MLRSLVGVGGEGVGVAGLPFAQNDTNEVVFRPVVVGLLHLRRDLVIRLGNDIFHADLLRVIPQGAERVNTCHRLL